MRLDSGCLPNRRSRSVRASVAAPGRSAEAIRSSVLVALRGRPATAVADPVQAQVRRHPVQQARRVAGLQPVAVLDQPHEHVLAGIHRFVLVAQEPTAAPQDHRSVSSRQRPRCPAPRRSRCLLQPLATGSVSVVRCRSPACPAERYGRTLRLRTRSLRPGRTFHPTAPQTAISPMTSTAQAGIT